MNLFQMIKSNQKSTDRLKKNFIFCIILVFSISTITVLSGCKDKKAEKKVTVKSTKKTSKNDPKKTDTKIEKKEPIKVKGLYFTGWNAGLNERLQHFINLTKKTEINSVVLDVKDDDGYIGYESKIPAVREVGGWKKKYDPKKVIKELHKNNVHVIGRVVCFKDPVLSIKKPDLAIKDSNGELFYAKGITWLDPYNKESWPIIIATAKEAVEFGFDEIQFDYLRFSNDGNRDAMAFNTGGKERYEIIDEFVSYARKEMPKVILSGDVFGIICESPADTEKIGQNLEYIGKNDLDYLSPMVYPSHYRVGQKINKIPFEKPDYEPYEVVYNTLLRAKERIAKVNGYRAKIRPYLQDFTATWLGSGYYKSYGAEDVRAQIKAVYDAGYNEWILWNASNKYTEEALLPKGSKEKITPKVDTKTSTKPKETSTSKVKNKKK